MPRDRQQPGLEARVAAEAVEAAERQQKRVLRGVFRVRVRSQRREGGAIDRRPMPIDQLAEGGRVPLPGPRDQVDIAHTDCRHTGGVAGWVDGRKGRKGGSGLAGMRGARDGSAGGGQDGQDGREGGKQASAWLKPCDITWSATASASVQSLTALMIASMCTRYFSSARRPAAVRRYSVRGTRPSNDLSHAMYCGVFELARVDAQVAVGRLQQPLQIVERQPLVHRQRADDAEPQPLVNQPIELQRALLLRRFSLRDF